MIQFLLEILLFVFAIFICFYLPGKFLLVKLKLSLNSPEDLFLPFVAGIMMFTLISYIFSWLKLEVIILPLFLILSFVVLKNRKWMPKAIDKSHRWPLIIAITLAIIFSLSMLMVGVYGDSITYRRDDLWHLALINELKTNFPPDHPGFSEVSLRGYHFFYNFLLAKISNIFIIPPLTLYFHYFPLLMAVLWGVGVYVLMFAWSRKVSIALWAVFLTMFGGSFAFILRLRGHEGLSLDSAFGIQQPATALINPPFAISIVIVIAVLFAFYQYFATKKKSWLVPIVLCVGLVSMFKIYAGIILLGSLLLLAFLQLLKRNFIFLVACFFIGILFVFTYGILRDPSSTLIFAPLWAPHSVLIDNMPWYGYAEKMYTYTKLSVIRGIIETELYSWYVFAFGNLGTRLAGLFFLPLFFLKESKKPSFFAFTVLIMTLISILIPLFFIQSGKVFEIIQMAWYFLFFISLFAAFGFYKLFSFSYNKILKIVLFIIIIILTLPSAYEPYESYIVAISSHGSSLSDPYFKAMSFLKSEGDYNQTVIEIPGKNANDTKKTVLDWYKKSSPAIVAFANKKSYLSNEYIDFTGVDIAPRLDFIRKIVLLNNLPVSKSREYINLQEEVKKGLKDNKISFIYSQYPLLSFEEMDSIRKVFENRVAGISIYRVEY